MLPLLMIVAVQALLTAAAGWILWKAWHRLMRRDSVVGRIVGAGLLLRAFGAQILFWVSFLGLPIARRLQDGDGFWKFAVDAEMYFGFSRSLVVRGWPEILLVDRTLPSPAYLQILAVFLLFFGLAATVGALLNLFAYLVCCDVVLRLGRLDGPSRMPTLVALAAVSFSPSLVLWSTQPLKDAFFVSMVAVFVAACAQWRREWLAADRRWSPLLGTLALLLVTLYAVAGIRWYFGILLCIVSLPFLLATVFASRLRIVAGIVNTLAFLLLLQVAAFISGPYLPRPLARMLHGSAAPQETAQNLVSVVEKSREGFDQTGGKSQIQEGETLARVDRTVKPAATTVKAAPAVVQPQQAEVAVPRSPRSTLGRIAAGMVAVVVPRFISERLGMIHVGGGGGLWPVVEADTLLFDMLLMMVIFHAVSAAAAGGLRDPSFWLIALMTAGITILLTYTISNFGTLFRHRSMILLGLSLLLAVSRASEPSAKTPEPVT
jgi:hypothetical protein